MNVLYLLKSYPIREYKISKKLKEKKSYNMFGAAFSKRNYIDIKEYNEDEEVFSKLFDFIEFNKKIHKKSINIYKELFKKEMQYNMPINKIIYSDRLIIHYNDTKRNLLVYSIIKFAEMILQNEKIDIVIGELSSASDLIFYYICKSKGIKYISFWHGRIKNKIEFTDIKGDRHGLIEKYNYYKSNGISIDKQDMLNSYLENFNKNEVPDYMNIASQIKIKSVYKKSYKENSVNRLYKYLKTYHDDQFSVDMPNNIKYKLRPRINKLKFPFKRLLLKKLFDEIDLNQHFIILPLHFQPEASTLTFATYYLNQLEFIINISKSIPSGILLYVKEHPSMFLDRNISFYKELKKIPNVKIVAPNIPIKKLLKHCKGVITLTNTTGYEAIIMDKPVFTFGNVFYNRYDYTFNLIKFEDLRDKIIEAIQNWDKSSAFREKNRRAFILATIESLYDGNLNSHVHDITVLSEENLNILADSIIRYISGN